MKKVFILGVICLAIQAGSVSWAQSRAWRCPGNYYTNSSEEARKIGGCTQLDDSKITIINRGGSGSSSGASRPSTGGGSTGTSSGGALRVDSSSNTSTTPAPRLVTPGEQQSRDGDARRLLELELSNKQNELAMLQREYNDGKPERLLSEAQDDTQYQNRVERLSREIESKVADINAIQNELNRLR